MQHTALTQTMVELIVMIVFVRILQPLREEPVAEPQHDYKQEERGGRIPGIRYRLAYT